MRNPLDIALLIAWMFCVLAGFYFFGLPGSL